MYHINLVIWDQYFSLSEAVGEKSEAENTVSELASHLADIQSERQVVHIHRQQAFSYTSIEEIQSLSIANAVI